MTGPGGDNFESQNFYTTDVNGNSQLFTQVDGVTTSVSPFTGTTVNNNESKLGFSDAVGQAAFDQRFAAIPTTIALNIDVPGVLSTDGKTTLITSAAVDGIATARFMGALTAWGGAAVAVVAVPYEIALAKMGVDPGSITDISG
jgi:hypothetical protein